MRRTTLATKLIAVVCLVCSIMVGLAEPAAALSPNQKFVTRLYQDFLGRPPDSSELSWGTAVLDGGGSRMTYAQSVFVAPPFRELYVNAIYSAYLTRSPSASELSAASTALQSSSNHLATEADVLESAEYLAYVDNDLLEFVGALYREILLREASVSEKSYYSTQIQNGTKTRRQVAVELLRSSEASGRRVNGYPSAAYCGATEILDFESLKSGTYCLVLDRLATSSEVSTWAPWYSGGGQIPGLWARLVDTAEYWTLSQS